MGGPLLNSIRYQALKTPSAAACMHAGGSAMHLPLGEERPRALGRPPDAHPLAPSVPHLRTGQQPPSIMHAACQTQIFVCTCKEASVPHQVCNWHKRHCRAVQGWVHAGAHGGHSPQEGVKGVGLRWEQLPVLREQLRVQLLMLGLKEPPAHAHHHQHRVF